MKTIRVLAVLVFSLFFYSNSFSQGETAIPTLEINPSPRLNALGEIGAVFPNNDPLGFYYNPAQLGYISQSENIALQVYPSNVNWIPQIFDIAYRNTSFNIGYNFEKMLNGLKLSAGFGYIHSRFDFGPYNNFNPQNINTNSNYPYDEFETYGLGIGIDYFVQLNIGVSYKNIYSLLDSQMVNGILKNYDASTTAMDYGILMTVPAVKLIDPGYQFNILQGIPASPYFNVSMGYSQLNVGKKIYYIDPAQSDPIPRTAKLGYTLSAGLDLKLNNSVLRAFGYDFIAEASDVLIRLDPTTNTTSYQSFIGDIIFGKNLIELKGDNNVVVHKGHNFSLFETVDFMAGRFDGGGYDHERTSGLGVRAKGVLTLLKAYTTNKAFHFIANHFDIQYYSAKIDLTGLGETRFEGVNVIFSGYEL